MWRRMRRFQKEHGRDRLCATYWAAPHTQRLYSAREWERECGAHSAPQRLYTSLLPFWTELPWFGPSGASFIPATHPDRCRVEWRSRPAHLGRRRLGLDGREHGSTLDWHGAKQACQHSHRTTWPTRHQCARSCLLPARRHACGGGLVPAGRARARVFEAVLLELSAFRRA